MSSPDGKDYPRCIQCNEIPQIGLSNKDLCEDCVEGKE